MQAVVAVYLTIVGGSHTPGHCRRIIVACRHGDVHAYDIVEGPMANDTIYNYVQDFIDGKISRAAFWELAKFKRPTHQICFCTAAALGTLTFSVAEEVYDG